jgi:hypothetical protein
MRTLIFATVVLIAAFSAAEAQSNFSPSTAALWNYYTDHVGRPQDRRQLAKLIFAYCDDVLRTLPRNKPSEDSWVEEETKSGVSERMDRVVGSVEVARKFLVDAFSECVSESDKLTKLVTTQPASEAVLWTRLAMVFSSPSEIGAYAERLSLTKFEEKKGWIDPNGFKATPLVIQIHAHYAAIETLGHRVRN